MLRDFGVAISYGCHVSRRILGVLLSDCGREVDAGDTWWQGLVRLRKAEKVRVRLRKAEKGSVRLRKAEYG